MKEVLNDAFSISCKLRLADDVDELLINTWDANGRTQHNIINHHHMMWAWCEAKQICVPLLTNWPPLHIVS